MATPASSAPDGGITWSQARGAFMVGNQVFYGYTDGFLHVRTFDGTTWGPDKVVDPYKDPVWDGVDTNDGTTFDGAYPSFYGQIPNVTGMFYSGGRVYYTLFGDSQLHSRWFSPDSGIIDETNVVSDSSVNFSNANGMFMAGGKLYYVTKADGNLHSVDFNAGVSGAQGTVSGTPVVVSGPGVDGDNWNGRGLFLYAGPPANVPPVAAYTNTCTNGSCSFDGSGSTDSDGTIASYSWNFGDGSPLVTTATANHVFAATGTYPVALTVTDNKGAPTTLTKQIAVTVPAPTTTVKFRASAHSAAGSSATKSVTVPASAQVGDTALLYFSSAPSAGWTGPTGISGLTQLDTITNSTLKSTVWEKTLTAADLGDTATVSIPSSGKSVLSMAVYSGVQAGSPIAQGIAHAGDSAVSNHVSPTVQALNQDVVVSYWADKSTGTSSWTAPAGTTTRDTAIDNGTTNRFGALIADSGSPVSAGTYGGLTATTNAASDKADMFTISLSPSTAVQNVPPTAAFTQTCTNGACAFDASGSPRQRRQHHVVLVGLR